MLYRIHTKKTAESEPLATRSVASLNCPLFLALSAHMTQPRRFAPALVQTFIATAFTRVGLPEADAQTIAALMTDADMQGSDGHGIIRLLPYITRIESGGVNVRPNIRVINERAATAHIDGDNGMGHLVMKRAAEMAIAKAKIEKLIIIPRCRFQFQHLEIAAIQIPWVEAMIRFPLCCEGSAHF